MTLNVNSAGQGCVAQVAIGDFVLYARVRRQGVTPKLVSTWTGPWRVVGADHSHVYSVLRRCNI